jgi:ATP-dependent RNA helicase DDX1
MNDVIGCYLDLSSGEIKFSKNGVDLGKAFIIPQQVKSATLFPAVVLKVSKTTRILYICF